MNIVKFVAYLFYRYYSTGQTKDIPYFSTLCALVMLFYIHLVQLLIIFNMVGLIPIGDGGTRIGKFFQMALFFLPIFMLFFLFVKKSDMETAHYDEQKIKRGNIILVIYVIASFSLMMFLAIIKKK